MKRIAAALVAGLLVLVAARADAGPRLDRIKQRGTLVCGVAPGIAGFAEVDKAGRYSGFEVDICRAVAAAIFGSAERVRFVQATSIQEFLKTPDVDLVSRRLTVSLTREAFGVLFGPIIFFDGQAFLVAGSAKAKNVRDLSGVPICVDAGTAFESILTQHFRAAKLELRKVTVASRDELVAALAGGRCSAYTADASELGAVRNRLAKPADYRVLEEYISKEPLASLMRDDDPLFFNIVRWSFYAMVEAEELGITTANVEQGLNSQDADTRRLLGVVPGNGKALGLDERWAYNVIKGVGNYGEMFDRNVGARSPIGLARGMNSLWTAGGLIYAPPLR